MNKKFLSVVLSASMVLSPLGGNYCFASDSKDDMADSSSAVVNEKVEEKVNLSSIFKKSFGQTNQIVLDFVKKIIPLPSSVSSSSNERNDMLKSCLLNLKTCADNNVEKKLELLSISKDRNQTVLTLENKTFYIPNNAYLSADKCFDAWADCATKNANLNVEIFKNTSPNHDTIFERLAVYKTEIFMTALSILASYLGTEIYNYLH